MISGFHRREYDDGFILESDKHYCTSKLRFKQEGLLLKCLLNIVVCNASYKPDISFYGCVEGLFDFG